jgi:hypothetical protein
MHGQKCHSFNQHLSLEIAVCNSQRFLHYRTYNMIRAFISYKLNLLVEGEVATRKNILSMMNLLVIHANCEL